MNKNKLLIGFVTLFAISNTWAAQQVSSSLQDERVHVVNSYIEDLEKADYQSIVQLFDKNGFVVSTSRGHVDAKEFFYGFLPEITLAHTTLHKTFAGMDDANKLTSRFHFTFTLKDGEQDGGEYVDEFTFKENSALLTSVYMFENLKFDGVE